MTALRRWATAVAAVLVVALVVFAAWHWASPTSPPSGGSGPPPPPFDIQNYTSSVDQAALTYFEWLPTGYSASDSYPFLLFLHGQVGHTDPGCEELDNHGSGANTLAAGIAAGFLVGAICTRTGNGWYVNSPFTGPQETDVLDAIAHEKSVRHVASVYLLGFSMGTVGTLSIATHHPGLLAGLGVVEPCPDYFQIIGYSIATNQPNAFAGFETTTNGLLPSAGGQALAETYYLSAFRFFPQNLTGLHVYVVDGGKDTVCPNNVRTWGFQEGNNTFLNSTCLIVASQNEPAGCTTPLAALPGAHVRFVYDPIGGHSLANLNGGDFIAYLTDQVADGTFWASGGATPTPPP